MDLASRMICEAQPKPSFKIQRFAENFVPTKETTTFIAYKYIFWS